MLIILLCLPAIAQTADPDALCALTIDCHYENKPVSGMGFSLYRVAALSPQGEHTLLPAYEDSGIVLGNLRDAADWRQAAGLLDQWVEQQSISPEKQLTTAADGKAALEGLPTGLYLLCAAPYQKGWLHLYHHPGAAGAAGPTGGRRVAVRCNGRAQAGALRYPRTAGHHHTG